MTPELSRRAARAFQHPPIVSMDPNEKDALAHRVEAADAFEDLDEADRALIEEAEANGGIGPETETETDEDIAAAAAGDVSTGAMLALVPSAADAERLALEDGLAADDLHVTLAYLGTAEGIPPEVRDAFTAALDALAKSTGGALSVEAFGAAVFNPTGDEPAHVLQVGGDGLTAVHDHALEAVHAAEGEGWTCPENHEPWQPHITLAYRDSDVAALDAIVQRVGPLTLDRVRLALAGEVIDVPLGGQVPLDDGIDAAAISETLATFNSARFRALTLVNVGSLHNTRIRPTGPVDDDGFMPFEGVALVEAEPTGDGRLFTSGSVRWEDDAESWPLEWQILTGPGHDNAVIVGQVRTIERIDSRLHVTGVIDTRAPHGEAAALLLERGTLGNVSVQVDDVPNDGITIADDSSGSPFVEEVGEVEAAAYGDDDLPLAPEDTSWDPDAAHANLVALATGEDGAVDLEVLGRSHLIVPDDAETPDPASWLVPFADVIDGTITAIPAGVDWALTEVNRLAESDVITSDDADSARDTLGEYFERLADQTDGDPAEEALEDIEASAWTAFQAAPALPAAAFREPQLADNDEHVHVEDGRIFGWVAQGGVCHEGYAQCQLAPLGDVDLSTFLRQPVKLDDGSSIRVGVITMNTGHANDGGNVSSFRQQFDDTRTVAGIITTGIARDKNGRERGMWFSGVPAPWLSEWDQHVFAACRPSGRWRRLRSGGWALRAVLTVPDPGYPNKTSSGATDAARAVVQRSNMAIAASAAPSADDEMQVERTAGTVAVALNLTLGDPDRQVIELIASALADELERREHTRTAVAALDDGMSEIRRVVAAQLRSDVDLPLRGTTLPIVHGPDGKFQPGPHAPRKKKGGAAATAEESGREPSSDNGGYEAVAKDKKVQSALDSWFRRGPTAGKVSSDEVQVLTDAIAAHGTEQPELYRGVVGDHAHLQIGERVELPATSFTPNTGLAQRYAEKNPWGADGKPYVLVSAPGTRGIDVSPRSPYMPWEPETLVAGGFRVVGRKDFPDGFAAVYIAPEGGNQDEWIKKLQKVGAV